VITDTEIVTLDGQYSPQEARHRFEARAAGIQYKRLELKAMDGAPITGEISYNGMRLVFCADGSLKVWYDSTVRVRSDNGAGNRENTASLCGHYEFIPRPASGTQALSHSSRPTELQ
jgi:hypothetical protein